MFEKYVLYNNINMDEQSKIKKSMTFGLGAAEGKINFKASFQNERIKTWDSYLESYKSIQTYDGRATNITAFIKEIENNFKFEKYFILIFSSFVLQFQLIYPLKLLEQVLLMVLLHLKHLIFPILDHLPHHYS